MVEITNLNVRRSSICRRGRRELDNGRQKPEIMVMTPPGGELFTDYLITSQTCHAKPKTQINRRRRYQLFPVGGMAYRKQLGPERLLRKVDAVALQQIKERRFFTYD